LSAGLRFNQRSALKNKTRGAYGTYIWVYAQKHRGDEMRQTIQWSFYFNSLVLRMIATMCLLTAVLIVLLTQMYTESIVV